MSLDIRRTVPAPEGPPCPRCPGRMIWIKSSWQCPDCTYKEGCCG